MEICHLLRMNLPHKALLCIKFINSVNSKLKYNQTKIETTNIKQHNDMYNLLFCAWFFNV